MLADPSLQPQLDALSPHERLQFEVLDSNLLDELGVCAVARVLQVIGERFQVSGEDDARKKGLVDLLEFLYILLQPSIRHVTRRLMEQQAPDGAVVALTMDITEGGTTNDVMYRHQLTHTANQILSYPGRFFPFVCVNTRRTDHFAIMERALVAQGYVGVKLYPSLGYQVDSQAMRAVYAYCAERGVPMLMHCSPGGFFRSKQAIHFSDPEHWQPILEDFPTMKICFAHFGGADNLVQAQIPADSWTQRILDLMEAYDGVYTDISYNDAPMDGGEKEARYFDHLKRILADPVRGGRILFGTDYFLVRMRVREENFWTYFEERLTGSEFKQMAERNPARFLGLPTGNAALSQPMQNYMHFVARNSTRCAALPAPWLDRAIKRELGEEVMFNVTGFGPRWTRNNLAHAWLFIYLRDNQMVPSRRPAFAEAGGLMLRELQYWTKEHDPPAIFDRKCAALAERIDLVFSRSGATYETGYDQQTVRRRLGEAVRDGHARLVDLAALCDALYFFPPEREERMIL